MKEVKPCDSCGKYVFATDAVTISVKEYAELLAAAAIGRSKRDVSRYRASSRSGIGLNPELADFILQKYETMTIKQVHAACVERFGDNVPSRSSIFRFVDKMKGVRN